MADHKKVLLFHIDVFTEISIRKAASDRGIQTIAIADDKWNISLGSLAGISGFSAAASGKPMEKASYGPMLLMSGLNPEEMDLFLDALKKAGVTASVLKAIMTPANIFWTPAQLYFELCRERTAL